VNSLLHLSDSTKELDKVWVGLFGGSATYWNEIKATLIEWSCNWFQNNSAGRYN